MRVNIFDRKISVWDSIKRNAANRKEVTIGDFLNEGSRHVQTIQKLRQLYNEAMHLYDTNPDASRNLFEEYRSEKEKLPLASISGNFSDGGRDENLLEATNVICLDIDTCKPFKAAYHLARGEKVPNSQVSDWETLKWYLSRIPYIAYCGLSVSAHGIYCLIPINDYHHHGEAWDALDYLFKKHFNLTIDEQTKDITRPRFISYDPNSYINTQAEVFRGILREKHVPLPVRRYTSSPSTITEEAVRRCVDEIERRNLDITSDYGEWIDIASALFNGLGETGKQYFERVSRFYPNANVRDINYKWEKNKNRSKVGIGTFFQICKRHQIFYKDADTFTLAPAPRPAPTAPPPPSATVEATPPKIVYRPLLPDPCSVIDSLTPQEFDKLLSPQAVAEWQEQHPAAPF